MKIASQYGTWGGDVSGDELTDIDLLHIGDGGGKSTPHSGSAMLFLCSCSFNSDGIVVLTVSAGAGILKDFAGGGEP